jgi:uncharacterized damage-inducible protein DinB
MDFVFINKPNFNTITSLKHSFMTNKEFFIQCWQNELPKTIGALKALPDGEKLSYRPAPKNRSAKELVDHIVAHAEDLIEAVEDGVINHRAAANYGDTENAIHVFETASEKLVSVLQNVDESQWNESKIDMYVFGMKLIEGKSLSDFCWMFMNDVIHHRGQLSSYIRPIGGVQPYIYGPTAEMVEEMMAKMASAN